MKYCLVTYELTELVLCANLMWKGFGENIPFEWQEHLQHVLSSHIFEDRCSHIGISHLNNWQILDHKYHNLMAFFLSCFSVLWFFKSLSSKNSILQMSHWNTLWFLSCFEAKWYFIPCFDVKFFWQMSQWNGLFPAWIEEMW